MTWKHQRWPAALVCAFLFLVPVVLWIWSTGNPLYYFRYSVPPGQGLYVVSRLIGLVALSLFWFQAMAALARGVPRLAGFFQLGSQAHRRLGIVLLVLMASHGLLFFAAVSLRTGHIAVPVLIPRFDAGYYTFYMGLGVLAFWLLPLGALAGFLRRRAPLLRWLHRIWVPIFALVLLHGLTIGTETRLGLMFYVYLLMAVSLMGAATLRFLYIRKARHQERDLHAISQSEHAVRNDG